MDIITTMFKLQPVVTLPEEWVRLCYKWGDEFVAEVKRRREAGESWRAHELAADGIEEDPIKQAKAKMAECATAIAFGMHPATVRFGLVPDPGWDFIWRHLKIDAKNSGWSAQYLLWPRQKNDILEKVTSDLLLFVQEDVPHFRLNGYVSRNYFIKHHEVAGPHHKLQPGTFCMHEDKLWDLHTLLGSKPPSQWSNIISCWQGEPSSAASTETSA